ncbi:MAG: NAD-dependent succinate-semialdehyde dehydrogenase [Spirochaetaceae bacterium]|nr:MAG: NAD-dependent succinate-semialdehyde dehydrogenase [Spirochaetaceae bacterium]
MVSINPANDKLIREYTEMSPGEVAAILDAAAKRFADWRRSGFARRADCLRRAAGLLRERVHDLAGLMTREMGKPIRDSRGEIEKSAWVCEYYADNGERFLTREDAPTEATHSFVSYQPLGVILAVMPWNFPFWQFFRFGAPALMAGNCCVLKHSSNVTGSALAIEALLRDAGFPEDVFRSLVIGSRQVAAVIEHPAVAAVTLTGSTPAGRAIAAACGAQLKKCVLELGGSDPYVILEDADLELTVPVCVTARLFNSGQSCIAGKRFIVVESIAERFEQQFVKQMAAQIMGDPMDERTQIGPQARKDLRDELHQQVRRSIDAGARCLLGCELPDSPGAYYPASVLSNVAPGMPAYDDELFGPVAAIIRVRNEAEAIRVANDSFFGLGAALFTRDAIRGTRIAEEEIEAGCVFVNEYVRSDPRLPFGGIKGSGYGRELSSFGIREFVNIKGIWVR